MKISCQSCHSKYNVADEKIQGKIVKIRCRKCGATIVVNAASGASANGSAPAPAPAPATPTALAEGTDASEWHVSVSDSDQRTMSLAELVEAYNTGVVAQDTFIWTDGMEDWKALSEVEVVVSALYAAAGQAEAAEAPGASYGVSAPVAASPSYQPAAAAPAYERAPAYAAGGVAAQASAAREPRRAAVVKREARARDLFATRSGEEVHTSAPAAHASAAPPVGEDDSRLTGQRNENSVLFSLEHLTRNATQSPSPVPGAARSKDDSGLIDLKALAAKAESMRPPMMTQGNALGPPLGLAPPLGFASPLGGPMAGGSEGPQRSKLPLLIGGGAGVALLLVLGIVIGLRLGGAATPGVAGTANSGAPLPSATAEPTPSATANVTAQASASASAAPVAASSAKPHAYGGATWHAGGGGAKPAAGGAAGAAGGAGVQGATPTATGAAGGSTPPAPAKKGDCGCNGDLLCMMKCSTH
jgi:predicted Zn finger-like uncharacterized protein